MPLVSSQLVSIGFLSPNFLQQIERKLKDIKKFASSSQSISYKSFKEDCPIVCET